MSRSRKAGNRGADQACHELVMPNASDSLHDIRAFTSAAMQRLALRKGTEWDVVLAVGEAATNSVLHGQSRNGPRNAITTKIEVSDDHVCVTLHDDGAGFTADVRDWPAPDLTSEKGRGIFIMKTLMDSVEYPKARQGTLCVLTKSLGRKC